VFRVVLEQHVYIAFRSEPIRQDRTEKSQFDDVMLAAKVVDPAFVYVNSRFHKCLILSWVTPF
jgi:hypothetical protein